MTVTPGSNGSGPPVGVAGSVATKPAGRRIRGLEAEERRQERRRLLLDSALELFATQGYAHTSIEQICQNAYVGFKSFYDEFATKEALFLALYDELLQRVGAGLRTSVTDTPTGPEGLRRMLTVFVRGVLDDPRVAQILFIEAAGLSPSVEATRRATYRGFAAFLHETYAAGRFSALRQPPPGLEVRRISLGVVGAIVAVMADWLVDPAPDDIERLVDDLVAYCKVVVAGIDATW